MKKKTTYQPKLETFERYDGVWGYWGYFSIDKSWWHGCREQFSRIFKRDVKKIYLNIGNSADPMDLVKFIARFEEEMKLPDKHRLKFIRYSNCRSVVEIIISPYWRANLLRRQLLTILIRVPLGYYGSKRIGFKHQIRQTPFLSATKDALNKFIKGNRRYKGRDFEGWVDNFRGRRNLKKLVK